MNARDLNVAVYQVTPGQRVKVAWHDGLSGSEMIVTVVRVGDTVTVEDEAGNVYSVWDTFGGPAIAGNPITAWNVLDEDDGTVSEARAEVKRP